MKVAKLSLVLMVLVLGFSSESINAQEGLIGAIKQKRFAGGCILRSHGNEQIAEDSILFSLNDDGRTAIMNIAGKDVILRLVKDLEKEKNKRYVWIFEEQTYQSSRTARRKNKRASETAKVTIYLTVISTEEEQTTYDAVIEATRGNRSETVKAKGGCFD
ncbi:MAG: hypothetical protein D6687_03115 [Acidobacteria bacterium]|jgi:hypothetical protein|nr:MAG: hypothetical protein D6687_03115 [Acidobacteriota bacterium]GIU81453.1 MAG: hypothetical protein KatS3mg006_0517 [Pyrinomonadaceae bacterium]